MQCYDPEFKTREKTMGHQKGKLVFRETQEEKEGGVEKCVS